MKCWRILASVRIARCVLVARYMLDMSVHQSPSPAWLLNFQNYADRSYLYVSRMTTTVRHKQGEGNRLDLQKLFLCSVRCFCGVWRETTIHVHINAVISMAEYMTWGY